MQLRQCGNRYQRGIARLLHYDDWSRPDSSGRVGCELLFFEFIAVSGFLAACATFNTGSHYDETTNFDTYRTFPWLDEVPYIGDESAVRINPFSQREIQRPIQTQMERSGYSFIEDRDNSEFAIAYTVSTRDKI